MASKYRKQIQLQINGILNVDEKEIIVELDNGKSISLSSALKSLNGKDIIIHVTHQDTTMCE